MTHPTPVVFLRILRLVFLLTAVFISISMLLNIFSIVGFMSDAGPRLTDWVTLPGDYRLSDLPQAPGKILQAPAKSFLMVPFEAAKGSSTAFFISGAVWQLSRYVLLLLALWQFGSIFTMLGQGQVFQPAVVHKIRTVAACVAGATLAQVLAGLTFQGLVHDLYDLPAGAAFSTEWIALGLLAALLIFGLGEIFARGVQLQQEQNLTI